jgi:uncharacterized protein YndB with AHSA1/START domain
MRGEFVAVEPPSRVVFTWGFENESIDVAPAASTIEVTLAPRDGCTRLTLVHRDLSASDRASHDGGWKTMLGRLASAVAQS